MARVLIASWSLGLGGRARALLSLCERLTAENHEVRVVTGERAEPFDRLAAHHGLDLAGEWFRTEWSSGRLDDHLADLVDSHAPGVLLAFDHALATQSGDLDVPTVGYCRTRFTNTPDEVWSPSPRLVARNDHRDMAVNLILPAWYLDDARRRESPPLADRDIHGMVHSRKDRDGRAARTIAAGAVGSARNVVYAGSFDRATLGALYERTRLFVFPRPDRYEPLGLMPFEAAAHGCRVVVPSNSGAAHYLPDHSADDPVETAAVLLDEGLSSRGVPRVPRSPTDVGERIASLADT